MAHPDDPLHRRVADIDRRLVLAGASLALVRRGFARRPAPARARACQVAEAEVDLLLDLRLAVTRPRR